MTDIVLAASEREKPHFGAACPTGGRPAREFPLKELSQRSHESTHTEVIFGDNSASLSQILHDCFMMLSPWMPVEGPLRLSATGIKPGPRDWVFDVLGGPDSGTTALVVWYVLFVPCVLLAEQRAIASGRSPTQEILRHTPSKSGFRAISRELARASAVGV